MGNLLHIANRVFVYWVAEASAEWMFLEQESQLVVDSLQNEWEFSFDLTRKQTKSFLNLTIVIHVYLLSYECNCAETNAKSLLSQMWISTTITSMLLHANHQILFSVLQHSFNWEYFITVTHVGITKFNTKFLLLPTYWHIETLFPE